MTLFTNTRNAAAENSATQYWQGALAAACQRIEIETAVLGIIDKGCMAVTAYGAPVQDISARKAPAFCVAKLFTATLIAQLAGQGKLHFQQAVIELLPAQCAASLRDMSTGVTVAHLLAHTHALGSMAIDAAPVTPEGFIDHIRVGALLQTEAPIAAPGLLFSYNLTGYILLGIIIEHLTQLTYGAFLEATILAQFGDADAHMSASVAAIAEVEAKPESVCPSSGKGLNLSLHTLLHFVNCYLQPAENALHLNDTAITALFHNTIAMPGWSPLMSGSAYGWKCFAGQWRGHNGTDGRQLMFVRVNRDTGMAICLIAKSARRHPGALAALLLRNTVSELSINIHRQPRMLNTDTNGRGVLLLGKFGNCQTAFTIRQEAASLILTITTTTDGHANCAHCCILHAAEGNLFFLVQPWQNIVFLQIVNHASSALRYLWDHSQLWPEQVTE